MTISAAESILMEVLWSEGSSEAHQIIEQTASQQEWTDATVKTLLNRLLKKKAIAAKRSGRGKRYLYTAIVTRDEYLLQESQGLLDRLFGGNVAPLVSYFSEKQKLSSDDVAELRQLLEKIDRGK